VPLPSSRHTVGRADGSGAQSAVDDLTVVVVDWNLPDHTIRCARTLIDDGVPPHRIVVVENGPTEANWSRIRAELAACTLVRIEENAGFAVANNVGAEVLPGRAYLLVNNDAFVHRAGSVAMLLRALVGDVGIVVPRLVNEDLSLQPSVAAFVTPLTALIRASGLSRYVPNRWQPRAGTHWDHATSREIETAIGAVMLIDGEAWSRLGGFDETSWMYAEDLDLCWRAHKLGWKMWFASDACFLHLKGTSSDIRWAPRDRAERVARAQAAMIRKHLSRPRAVTTLTFMRLGLAGRAVLFSAMGKNDAAETCRGWLDGLAGAAPPNKWSRQRPAIEVISPGTA
jgi:GT2 family glycosyltransferase